MRSMRFALRELQWPWIEQLHVVCERVRSHKRHVCTTAL